MPTLNQALTLIGLAICVLFYFVLTGESRTSEAETKLRFIMRVGAGFVAGFGGLVLGIFAINPDNPLGINILVFAACCYAGISLAAEVEKKCGRGGKP